MFLNQLEESEKIPFYAIAQRFAMVDNGQIDENEMPLLLAMQSELGVNNLEVGNGYNLSELPTIFKTRKSRKIVLIQLLGIAYTHGVIDEKQKEYILSLTEKFKIELSELERIENWVVEILHLTAEGFNLINQ